MVCPLLQRPRAALDPDQQLCCWGSPLLPAYIDSWGAKGTWPVFSSFCASRGLLPTQGKGQGHCCFTKPLTLGQGAVAQIKPGRSVLSEQLCFCLSQEQQSGAVCSQQCPSQQSCQLQHRLCLASLPLRRTENPILCSSAQDNCQLGETLCPPPPLF